MENMMKLQLHNLMRIAVVAVVGLFASVDDSWGQNRPSTTITPSAGGNNNIVTFLSGQQIEFTSTVSGGAGAPYTYTWFLHAEATAAGFAFVGATDGATARVMAPTRTTRSENFEHGRGLALTVRDSAGVANNIGGQVLILRLDAPPTADAGTDQIVASGATVTLDGSGSEDLRTASNPSGGNATTIGAGTVTYLWTRSGGTGNAADITLSDMRAESPTFTAPTIAPGDSDETHIFTLRVEDSSGQNSEDMVMVTVTAPPPTIAGAATRTVGSDGTLQLSVENPVSGVTYTWGVSGITQGGSTVQNPAGENAARLGATRTGNSITFTAPTLNEGDADRVYTIALTGGSSQAGTFTITVTPPSLRAVSNDPIREPIFGFLKTRGALMLSHQPDLAGVVRRSNCGNINVEITGDGTVDGEGKICNQSVWAEVAGSKSKDKTGDGDYSFAAIGAHLGNVLQKAYVGVMAQFDKHEQALDNGRGSIDGLGWMIGPYMVSELEMEGVPIHLSSSFLFGQTQNDISFNDAGTLRIGTFDTTRILIDTVVTAEFALELDNKLVEKMIFLPYTRFTILGEQAEEFTDSEGRAVLEQIQSTTQFDLGMRFEVPVTLKSGILNVRGGKGVILSYSKNSFQGDEIGTRSKAELGVAYDINKYLSVGVDAFYDGLYNPGFKNWGANVGLEARF